jgi:hypothetical protein
VRGPELRQPHGEDRLEQDRGAQLTAATLPVRGQERPRVGSAKTARAVELGTATDVLDTLPEPRIEEASHGPFTGLAHGTPGTVEVSSELDVGQVARGKAGPGHHGGGW